MKLYICHTTSGGKLHPCAKAYQSLVDAGCEFEVEKVRGSRLLPTAFQTSGRKTVKTLSGNYKVPTLVLDDGTVIDDSANIIEWAISGHP